ncbi:MAG TPA: alpha/beta hydrolase family protein [Pyrinomonadaceae bacterium]|nr:alpha/beta hydrolase family protein [Pyrinomonadaceae bacterium]
MTKHFRFALLVTTLLSASLSLLLLAGPNDVRAATDIFAASTRQEQSQAPKSGRIQTIQFESKLVGKTLPYNVLLPVDYEQPGAKAKHYPVLYLLHGFSGHHDNWTTKTKLSDYAAQYSMIIVTPEGNDSWYIDSATVPSDKYEKYIIEELIPDVQRRFRVSAVREARAIAGLSMGGYGALKFGFKHPEMFAFAGSLSGAISAAMWGEKELSPGPIRESLLQTFGPADSSTRVANDVPRLAREFSSKPKAALPFLYIDCGTEDFLFKDNRDFMQLLAELKIPHEYRQLPGTHNWKYWDTQVQEVLRIASRIFSEPASKAKTAAP